MTVFDFRSGRATLLLASISNFIAIIFHVLLVMNVGGTPPQEQNPQDAEYYNAPFLRDLWKYRNAIFPFVVTNSVLQVIVNTQVTLKYRRIFFSCTGSFAFRRCLENIADRECGEL